MNHAEAYLKKKNPHQQYSAIKMLVDEYFKPEENKKYEDFIRKLVMILNL